MNANTFVCNESLVYQERVNKDLIFKHFYQLIHMFNESVNSGNWKWQSHYQGISFI